MSRDSDLPAPKPQARPRVRPAPGQSFTPSAETRRQYRMALGSFATGVTVITTRTATGPVGITANSFASVSLDPPLVLWSPARASGRFRHFAEARHFAIHVLAEDQADLCAHFVRPGHEFEGLDMHESAAGVPLLGGCLARFECETAATHDGGDHLIIVGRVLRAMTRPGMPLLFSHGKYGGFTPDP